MSTAANPTTPLASNGRTLTAMDTDDNINLLTHAASSSSPPVSPQQQHRQHQHRPAASAFTGNSNGIHGTTNGSPSLNSSVGSEYIIQGRDRKGTQLVMLHYDVPSTGTPNIREDEEEEKVVQPKMVQDEPNEKDLYVLEHTTSGQSVVINSRLTNTPASSSVHRFIQAPTQPNTLNPLYSYTHSVSGFTSASTASLWEYLTLSWISPLIHRATMTRPHRLITAESHLPRLPEHLQANITTQQLSEAWHHNRLLPSSSRLLTTIKPVHCSHLTRMLFLRLFHYCFVGAQPVLLYFFLDGVISHVQYYESVLYIIGLAGSIIFSTFLFQRTLFLSEETRCMSEAALKGMVYDKLLKVHMSEVDGTVSDADATVDDAEKHLHDLLTHDITSITSHLASPLVELDLFPFLILPPAAALIYLLGVSALVGIGGMIFGVILSASLLGKLHSSQEVAHQAQQQRSEQMKEVIGKMKTIKLYAWEPYFSSTILNLRRLELSSLISASHHRTILRCITLLLPSLVTFLSFMTFLLIDGYGAQVSGKLLDAKVVFTCFLLFMILGKMMDSLPLLLHTRREAFIGLQHVTTFLEKKEKDRYVDSQKNVDVMDKDGVDCVVRGGEFVRSRQKNATGGEANGNSAVVQIAAASSSSSSSSSPSRITLPSLSISSGAFWLVIDGGSASGGGDTSGSEMIDAILGEMATTTKQQSSSLPQIIRRRRIAYTSSLSYLPTSTIRDLILSSLSYDEMRYKEVLHCCALINDLALWKDGEKTVVGEDGVPLTKNQRLRISLARAIYSDADLYLLDNPFSSVSDTNSAVQWIYEKTIGPNSILQQKTRLLVVNQQQVHSVASSSSLLNDADRILLLKDGKIQTQGTYQEIQLQLNAMLQPVSQHHRQQSEMMANRGGGGGGANKEAIMISLDGVGTGIVSGPSSPSSASPTTPSSPAPISPQPDSPTSKSYNRGSGDDDGEKGMSISGSTSSSTTAGPKLIEQVHHESLTYSSFSYTLCRDYLLHGSSSVGYFALILLLLISQAFLIAADYWLAKMTQWCMDAEAESNMWNQEQSDSSSYKDFLSHSTPYYIIVYAILTAGALLLLPLRTFFFTSTTSLTAGTLHDKLYSSIIRSPQHYFEQTSRATVLSRFTRDQDVVDRKLPEAMMEILSSIALIIGVIVLHAYVTLWTLIPSFFVLLTIYFAQAQYRPIQRHLAVMYETTSHPLTTHMKETVAGLKILRAYGYQGAMERSMQKFYTLLDAHTRITYTRAIIRCWLSLRIECLSGLFVLSAGILGVRFSDNAGLIGLIVCVALGTPLYLSNIIHNLSSFELGLSSVSRITDCLYLRPEETHQHSQTMQLFSSTTKVAKETRERNSSIIKQQHQRQVSQLMRSGDRSPSHAASTSTMRTSWVEMMSRATSTSSSLLSSWPQIGSIEFEDFSVAYTPNPSYPCVLKNISASITGGEKIGIVGKELCGKSTLALALFRMVDVRSGRLLVDGIDISSISLYQLRSRLSIIPSSPQLFHTTLRANLDPYQTATDERIWTLLEQVNLHSVVMNLPDGLEYQVKEDDSHFSQAQCRLICLARAVLRQSRIVVIDEPSSATSSSSASSSDPDIDRLFRRILKEHFRDATVLTITHRLNTILDTDRIMVFDQGKLVEFDTPRKLLSSSRGYLSHLVHETTVAAASSGRARQQSSPF